MVLHARHSRTDQVHLAAHRIDRPALYFLSLFISIRGVVFQKYEESSISELMIAASGPADSLQKESGKAEATGAKRFRGGEMIRLCKIHA